MCSKRYFLVFLSLVLLLALLAPLAYAETAEQAPEKPIPAYSRITLHQTSVTLTVLEKRYIWLGSSKPVGAAEDEMVYSSANPKVAAVEQANIIRAVAPGKTTITVRAKNGKARATLRVTVRGFNKKLRFYDAATDAEQTAQKAPAVYQSAPKLSYEALTKKYGKDPTDFSMTQGMTPGDDPAGLYYALLYSLLNAGTDSHGYFVIPERFPGCSDADMAAIRTWLREGFDGIVIGMSEDYGKNASFAYDDLYSWGGTALQIDSVAKVSATRFTADVSEYYGNLGAGGYRVLLERAKDGWRIDHCEMIWIS